MRTYVSGRRVAFTLIELLVALTIIVALTMLCMPAIGPMMNVSSVDNAASIVRAGLMRARHSAVAQQREGFCVVAVGSVIESGIITSSAGSSAGAITIDNAAASGVTVTGTWTTSTVNPRCHLTNYLHDQNSGQGTKSVRFTPTLTDAGTYDVSMWFPDNTTHASNVPVDIVHANGTDVVNVDQKQVCNDWLPLGTYDFDAGTAGSVVIRTDGANGYVMADAVRFTPAGNAEASDTFVDNNRTVPWTTNMWADKYYVEIGAKDADTGEITTVSAKIKSNANNTITAVSKFKNTAGVEVVLTTGSRYVIHQGDPNAPGSQQTVGSGTSDADGTKELASWDKLPEGAAVSVFDADTDGDNVDDDVCGSGTCGLPAIGYLNGDKCPHCGVTIATIVRRGIFPIIFTSKGRAKYKHTPPTTKDYITVKIYSSEHPHDANLWRYVRLYRNSGRGAIGNKLSDFD